MEPYPNPKYVCRTAEEVAVLVSTDIISDAKTEILSLMEDSTSIPGVKNQIDNIVEHLWWSIRNAESETWCQPGSRTPCFPSYKTHVESASQLRVENDRTEKLKGAADLMVDLANNDCGGLRKAYDREEGLWKKLRLYPSLYSKLTEVEKTLQELVSLGEISVKSGTEKEWKHGLRRCEERTRQIRVEIERKGEDYCGTLNGLEESLSDLYSQVEREPELEVEPWELL